MAGERQLSAQQDWWADTFTKHPDMFGDAPSEPAVATLARLQDAGIADVLELGAGQGRDTLFFARNGLRVRAFEYAAPGVVAMRSKASSLGLDAAVDARVVDAREPLPLDDDNVGACYSHMLFCMALTTQQLEDLVAEVRRVVRPGGLVVYTVRNTDDSHYGAGVSHGDGMYEHGGFIVHFFDRPLVDRLAAGFELVDVESYTEGDLPRRLWCVTMRVPGP
jgi:SAM-dependent methyltransferase